MTSLAIAVLAGMLAGTPPVVASGTLIEAETFQATADWEVQAKLPGFSGEGYLADEASALSNTDFLVSASDDYILQGILRGRPGTSMSAWSREMGGPLSPEEARTILSFIRSWQKGPSVELSDALTGGNADHGAKTYARWCPACHGKYGDGGTDIEALAYLYKNQIYQIADYLKVTQEIIKRSPSPDTFSLPVTDQEFFFRKGGYSFL